MSKIDPEIESIVKTHWGYYARMVEALSEYMKKPMPALPETKPVVVEIRTFGMLQQIARKTIRSGEPMDCGICLKPITDVKDLTIDHILPKAAGGKNNIENLQLAHKLCNTRKGDTYIPKPGDSLKINGKVIGRVKIG